MGAARALQGALGGDAEIVATLICGDNFFHDERERARHAVREALRSAPSRRRGGRAGLRSGPLRHRVCARCAGLADAEGLPAVTAMHPSNPGVLMHGREVLVVPTAASAAGMQEALGPLVRLALKLARGEALGTAESEGYLSRGIRRVGSRPEPGYRRAVDMLLAKLNGRPYVSEIPYQAPAMVQPAPPVADLGRASVALVTTGGLVPKGNPDGQTSGNAQKYFRYPIDQLQSLAAGRVGGIPRRILHPPGEQEPQLRPPARLHA